MKLIHSLCVLGIAAAFVVSIPTALQAQEFTIAGTWTINEEESDDLQQVMGPRAPGIRRAETTRGISDNARGGGGDGRGGRAQLSDEQIQVGQAMMRLFREGGQRLAIAETDSTVIVITGGRNLTYYVNERKVEGTISGGVEVEVKAKWDKDKFKVETKASGNVRITQEFELDDDSGRLKVKTKLSNSRMEQNFTLERVYDPAT